MPLSPEERAERRAEMFGDSKWPDDFDGFFKNMPHVSMRHVASGLVMAACSPNQPEEERRFNMNRALYVIDNYLVTKPSEKERQTLERVLDCDLGVDDERRIRWLMDERR